MKKYVFRYRRGRTCNSFANFLNTKRGHQPPMRGRYIKIEINRIAHSEFEKFTNWKINRRMGRIVVDAMGNLLSVVALLQYFQKL